MRVKVHCSLALVLVVVGVACGEPDETDDQSSSPIQMGGLPEAGGFVPPDAGGGVGGSVVDAAPAAGPEAGAATPDAGPGPVMLDGGGVIPGSDGGAVASSDAGNDAGSSADAGGGGDGGASGCALTYENFGKQFMTKYCTNCHTGLFASHFVQLDTLANVQANKAAVKQQAVTRTTMPQADPKPTAAERQQLGQWLDCGPN